MVMTKVYVPYACYPMSGLLEWPDETDAVLMRIAVYSRTPRLRMAHRVSLLWY